MDESKQSPASQPERSETPSPAATERPPSLRQSASVREHITRMVAALNNFKAKE